MCFLLTAIWIFVRATSSDVFLQNFISGILFQEFSIFGILRNDWFIQGRQVFEHINVLTTFGIIKKTETCITIFTTYKSMDTHSYYNYHHSTSLIYNPINYIVYRYLNVDYSHIMCVWRETHSKLSIKANTF